MRPWLAVVLAVVVTALVVGAGATALIATRDDPASPASTTLARPAVPGGVDLGTAGGPAPQWALPAIGCPCAWTSGRGRLYYADARRQELVAVDLFDGSVAWTFDLSSWSEIQDVVLRGDAVVVSPWSGWDDRPVVVLDASDGRERWHAPDRGLIGDAYVVVSPPAEQEVPEDERPFRILRLGDGSFVRSGSGRPLQMCGDAVLVARGDRSSAFEGIEDGRERVRFDRREPASVCDDDVVVVGTEREVQAFDPITLAPRWQVATGASGALRVIEDLVLVDDAGVVRALEVGDGSERWAVDDGWSDDAGLPQDLGVAGRGIALTETEAVLVDLATGDELGRSWFGMEGQQFGKIVDGLVLSGDGRIEARRAEDLRVAWTIDLAEPWWGVLPAGTGYVVLNAGQLTYYDWR